MSEIFSIKMGAKLSISHNTQLVVINLYFELTPIKICRQVVMQTKHIFKIARYTGWENEDKRNMALLNKPYQDTNTALFPSCTLSRCKFAINHWLSHPGCGWRVYV